MEQTKRCHGGFHFQDGSTSLFSLTCFIAHSAMQKSSSHLHFQAKLTTARLIVVSSDVIIHVILCKNKMAAVRRPFIWLNSWNSTSWKALLCPVCPEHHLLCICRPEEQVWFGDTLHAPCLPHPPHGHSQNRDYHLLQFFIAPAWEWGIPGSRENVLRGTSRDWRRADPFPRSIHLSLQAGRRTLAFFWSAGPSPPAYGTRIKLVFIPTGWTEGTDRQTYFCCAVTPPSYLFPHGYSSEREALRTACDLSCLLPPVNVGVSLERPSTPGKAHAPCSLPGCSHPLILPRGSPCRGTGGQVLFLL